MKLVITEKPSVARDIGKVLNVDTRKDGYLEGNGYIITWCFGHLIQLSYPGEYDEKYNKWVMEDLPIVPKVFKTEINKSTSKQYYIIKKLMDREDVNEIICATDSAREGELIFRYVYNKANCKKPFKRLWISSQTEKAVKEGFENLRQGTDYDNLYKSALCRAEADWLIGLNLTRLYTIKNNTKLTIGRCQTATLYLIVNRYLEIQNFKKEKYYQLDIKCENNIKATYCIKEDKEYVEAKYKTKEIAQGFMNNIPGKGIIKKYEKNKKITNRPLLFSLNELQKEANKKYGYTAKETLDIAQKLYEVHKVTTYPRTNARYLDSNTEYKIKDLITCIGKNEKLGYREYVNEIIDDLTIDSNIIKDEAIEDHHALFITENIKDYDINKLDEKEKNILNLIIIRVLLALSKKQEFEETKIEIGFEKISDILKIKGKNVLFEGWKSLEKRLLGEEEKEEESSEQNFKLDKKIGEEIELIDKKIIERETTPKKQYTDGTLISTMENLKREFSGKEIKKGLEHGIGTTATRAEIIEKLISVGYIERNKKALIPKKLGIDVIKAVPYKIKSPELTAQWENKLKEVEKGNLKDTIFIEEIVDFLNEIFEYEKNNINKIEVQKEAKEVIGKCPKCGKNIFESSKNFYCEGFKDTPKCNFTLWKEDKFFNDRGKKITKSIAKDLINKGQAKVKFKKKDGSSTYEALVKIVEKGKYINFELEFI
ncbi:DNA topoisomerase 3 (plasmid) [Clostridium perfringens]|uniref:DNA topoisomerase 3 n=1 Tax=Clostridium perfringens TaxID=1502 RepID=UPI0024BCD751|nr:DNA topoisomerase 3 [Clostridium perfringens]